MSLEIHSISKRFGAVQANRDVGFTVEPGALHGVLGENGAGKSTLMKILSGFQPPDSGSVTLGGVRLELGSPRKAVEAGVGMLHQDPLVALPFTVLENFVLGDRDRAGARETLRSTADRLGFDLDPDRVTRTLTVGERQQLEMVRLLARGVEVLILDEPTSGITAGQREALFAALRTLASEGLIVLFVSHKLEEVIDLCTSVTVMRRGEVVDEIVRPFSSQRLVEAMFGAPMEPREPAGVPLGSPAVELRGLEARDGRNAIAQVDLVVREGEVMGLAGLEGSGQRTLLRAVAGLVPAVSGSVAVDGDDLTGHHLDRFRRSGVHYLPAGRLEEGLFPGLTVEEHLRLAFPDEEDTAALAATAIDRFHIKAVPASTVDGLSGGNQQRLLLAMMPGHIRVLLMEQPTRGLDIESADLVWETILARRAAGTAVMFASADLDELVRYSDRIAVCFDGRVLEVVDAHGLDSDRLGRLIGGMVTT